MSDLSQQGHRPAGGSGRLEVAEVPVPEPGAGEVLVRVRACGICGTDPKIAAHYHSDCHHVFCAD